ncbi:MAG: glutamine synthetase, partial [Halieaceae bacterium]|nr:glutamine synthetase [Halieaceae bacterium]
DLNPYLLFAVLLAAMMEGMQQKLVPDNPVTGDGYSQETELLPVYMQDAVKRFGESNFIKTNLGSELQRIYTLTKEQEIAEFRRRITALEYQSYLEIL